MSPFGSELKYHPKLKDLKASPLIPFLRLYQQVFGLFGFYGGGEYLRSLYFRKIMDKYKFKLKYVLDAGCGYGYYSFYLAKKYPHVFIDACDLDSVVINENKYIQNRMRLKNLNFFELSLTQLSVSNKYDMVISVDVIELIEDDQKVTMNISRALKKGGYFLLHTPKKNPSTFNSLKVNCLDRVRDGYTKKELYQLLEGNGFQIIENINTFGIFSSLGIKVYSWFPRWIQRIFAIPMNFINYLDALIQHKRGNAIFVVARKR